MLSAQEIKLDAAIYIVDIKDTIGSALSIINNLQLRHLIVQEGDHYFGVLTEEQILEYNSTQTIQEIKDLRRDIFVLPNTNFLDIFYKMVNERLSLCPIVENGIISGAVLFTNLSDYIIEYLHLDSPGKLIVAEMLRSQYSMASICRILETEGHKVLMAFAREIPTTGNYIVAIKTNSYVDASLINTFERYGINILANYSEEGFDALWKDRYESFMNYLNV
jgi:acetoin utilization protein AcuB